jgi:hypothetical protein
LQFVSTVHSVMNFWIYFICLLLLSIDQVHF